MEINEFTSEEKKTLVYLIDEYTKVYNESVAVAEIMKKLEAETQELFNKLKNLREEETKIYVEFSERSGDSIESAKQKAAKFLLEKNFNKN